MESSCPRSSVVTAQWDLGSIPCQGIVVVFVAYTTFSVLDGVNRVVLTRSLSMCPTPPHPPCEYARVQKTMYAHRKNPVVHVRVRWIMETHKNNQHVVVPPKMERGYPTGGGIKNGDIRYAPPLPWQKEKKRKAVAFGICRTL